MFSVITEFLNLLNLANHCLFEWIKYRWWIFFWLQLLSWYQENKILVRFFTIILFKIGYCWSDDKIAKGLDKKKSREGDTHSDILKKVDHFFETLTEWISSTVVTGEFLETLKKANITHFHKKRSFRQNKLWTYTDITPVVECFRENYVWTNCVKYNVVFAKPTALNLIVTKITR